ncbi:MAG: hypothetical protein FIB08_14680 [Candidatus Methanoperedens sp.]|nr:hypothetical protein [Candidatus Methanoperedens sp.]
MWLKTVVFGIKVEKYIRKKKTLTEVIDTITRIALRHEDELMEAKKLPPIKRDPAMKPPIDWGVKTDASKADEYIYTEE